MSKKAAESSQSWRIGNVGGYWPMKAAGLGIS